jgi:hypothetical protein
MQGSNDGDANWASHDLGRRQRVFEPFAECSEEDHT